LTLNEARKICAAYNRERDPDSNCKAVVIYEDAGCPLPYVMHTETGAIVRRLKGKE